MIDRPVALRAASLFAWTGFFSYLWITGAVTRYLGPRTYWVVPFGAVTLALAALGHVPFLRSERPRPASRSDWVGAVALVIPLLAVAAVPNPDLGALAASRKSTGTGVGTLGALAPEPDPTTEISFIDIHYASESEDYAYKAGIAEGRQVQLVGFVTPADVAGASFELTRFYVSCCAADAIPYSVAVADAPSLPTDTWLRVRGSLARSGRRFVVIADEVVEVDEPKDPYLY